MHFQFQVSLGNYCTDSHYFSFDKKDLCFDYENNCTSITFNNIKNVVMNEDEFKHLDCHDLEITFEMFKCGAEHDWYLEDKDGEYKQDNYFAMPDLFKIIDISIKDLDEKRCDCYGRDDKVNLEFDYDNSELVCQWSNRTFRPDHW